MHFRDNNLTGMLKVTNSNLIFFFWQWNKFTLKYWYQIHSIHGLINRSVVSYLKWSRWCSSGRLPVCCCLFGCWDPTKDSDKIPFSPHLIFISYLPGQRSYCRDWTLAGSFHSGSPVSQPTTWANGPHNSPLRSMFFKERITPNLVICRER